MCIAARNAMTSPAIGVSMNRFTTPRSAACFALIVAAALALAACERRAPNPEGQGAMSPAAPSSSASK